MDTRDAQEALARFCESLGHSFAPNRSTAEANPGSWFLSETPSGTWTISTCVWYGDGIVSLPIVDVSWRSLDELTRALDALPKLNSIPRSLVAA
jgi:hypothetical protein